MSDNKLKYFKVATTTVVKANNKADAIAIATKQRGYSSLEGQTLNTTTDAERVSATEVRSITV